MRIKCPTEFSTFTDGRLSICSVTGNLIDKVIETVAYGKRSGSYRRYYAARAANIKLDLIVVIPLREYLDASYQLVINGERYRIQQVQHVRESNPPTSVLSLTRVGNR